MKAVLIKNIQETDKITRLRFKPDEPLQFKAGQFITINLLGDKPQNGRPYSLGSDPHQTDWFELIIRINPEGYLTPKLKTMKEGEQIELKGPFGRFLLDYEEKNPAVFIAGGSGIAPIRSMIYEALGKGYTVPMHLFYGNRSETDIALQEEFKQFTREHHHFTYVPTVNSSGASWEGHTGFIIGSMVSAHVTDIRACTYYLCGPPPMIEKLIMHLDNQEVPKEHIRHEKWG